MTNDNLFDREYYARNDVVKKIKPTDVVVLIHSTLYCYEFPRSPATLDISDRVRRSTAEIRELLNADLMK